MDIPLKKRKPTWRESEYTRITVETLVAYMAVLVLSLPPVILFALKLHLWAELSADPEAFCKLILEMSLWIIPYTWCYFLAIEKIRKMSRL
jgi:hypothetical protein